jgi:hypothetical protein
MRAMRSLHVLIAIAVGIGSAHADEPGVAVDTAKRAPAPPAPKPVDPDAPVTWDVVRWQAPDGVTASFAITAKRDAAPVLTVSTGDDRYDIALKDAFKTMVPAFVAIDDDVVITTGATPGVAWRFAWKKGRVVLTKSVYWATDKKRPAWTLNPPAKDAAAAARRIAGLLRFGGTAPGLPTFFADAAVSWHVFTRGDKTPWKRSMTGRDVLQKWKGAGYPVVRGKLKVVKNCVTVAANADGKPVAVSAPPDAPHLLELCVDKDLHVESVKTLIAPDSPDAKPADIQ